MHIAVVFIMFFFVVYQCTLPLSFVLAATDITQNSTQKNNEKDAHDEESVEKEDEEKQEIENDEENIEEEDKEVITSSDEEEVKEKNEEETDYEEIMENDNNDNISEDTQKTAVCEDDCSNEKVESVNDVEVNVVIDGNAQTGNNMIDGDNEDESDNCEKNKDNQDDVDQENEDENNNENDNKDKDDICDDSDDENNEESGEVVENNEDNEQLCIQDDASCDDDVTEVIDDSIGIADNAINKEQSSNETALLEEQESAEIISGDAQSAVTVINVVNTNSIGANWLDLIYNIDGLYEDDIDLFAYFTSLLEHASPTQLQTIADIYNKNSATVTNDVTAHARSGDNMIQNVAKASITTGDAIAGVDIVNIVNRNLVGNNWLFAMINVFGLWTGDLIVPGNGVVDDVDNTYYDHVAVVNDNDVKIKNAVDVGADTGNNATTDNEGNVTIETGEATAVAKVKDVVNTNIVGNNWFFLLINNMGTWTGNIIGWDSDDNIYKTVFRYVFGANEKEQCEENCTSLRVHNENNATVTNIVEAQSSTGNNTITTAGEAHITSGDATAWARIFNFINSNIVGNNWLFSIVNVMGEWHGNTVFAYPDLIITMNDGRDSAMMGEEIHYTVTYENIGQAPAKNVAVMVVLPKDVVYENDTSGYMPTVNGTEYVWHVGNVTPGEKNSFAVSVKIEDDTQIGEFIQSNGAIRTETAEVDLDNNYTIDKTRIDPVVGTIAVGGNESYEYKYSKYNEQNVQPVIQLSRVSSVQNNTVRIGELVTHRIVMQNIGNAPVYNVALRDKITDDNGSELVNYEWDIGDLDTGEIAIIDYAIIINGGSSQHEYNFMASARGYDHDHDKVRSNEGVMRMAVLSGGNYYATTNTTNSFLPSLIPNVFASDGNTIHAAKKAYDADSALQIWLLSIFLYVLVTKRSLFLQKRKDV